MYRVLLEPTSVLYVPPGYVVIEKVLSGQCISYVRASVLHKSDESHGNGKAAVTFFTALPIRDKMVQLVDMMKSS